LGNRNILHKLFNAQSDQQKYLSKCAFEIAVLKNHLTRPIFISLDLIFHVYILLEGKRLWRAEEDEWGNGHGHPKSEITKMKML